jgi:Arc/MetJ-type ribon-helix-helix transcriptional regulator
MKSWHAEIQQHIQDWSQRLGNLRWWPRYVYHFTDVQNAVSILTDGMLFSRAEAEKLGRMIIDNASPDVIAQTRPEHTQFARLYFRPRTPTQYRNEGIRPLKRRELGGAHCPMPIYFCFDALEVLSQDTTEVSDGNMGSLRASHSRQRDFFFGIPFQYVFHNRAFPPDARDEIIFRRNAEVLVPQQLSLEPFLKFLACRSAAERQTLMHLLPHEVALKWDTKIRLGEWGFFERRWTYGEKFDFIWMTHWHLVILSSLKRFPFNKAAPQYCFYISFSYNKAIRRCTMTAKVMVSFPDEFLAQVDAIAEAEHRSRSELVREALRQYIVSRETALRPIDRPEVQEAIRIQDEIAQAVPSVGKDSTKDVRYWRDRRR